MRQVGAWRQLSTRVVYENNWIRVREDRVVHPDGSPGLYGVVETYGPSVFAIALDDEERVTLVEVDRYPTGMRSWEVPAGGSMNEPPEEAAKRELWEETGLTAREWQEVGFFQSANGMCSDFGRVFVARGLSQGEGHRQEEEGILGTRRVSLPEAMEMIRRGDISDGQSIAALTQAVLWLRGELGAVKPGEGEKGPRD